MILRGTGHGRSPPLRRSSGTARLFFVNVDDGFTAELKAALGEHALSNLYE